MKKLICAALTFTLILSCFSFSASALDIKELFPDEPPSNNPNAVILPDIIDPGDNVTDDDYDGIEFGLDTSDASNTFSGTLYTEQATSSISYKMDYRWFFGSNTTYIPDLAVISSLLSAVAYAPSHITGGGSLTTTAANAMNFFMGFHGMSEYMSYSLTNSDTHVSQMFVANRKINYNGTQKTIVCVVVRGTNGTLDEWSSNFDVGPSTSDHSEWTNAHNHKGFDITANRLNTHLTSYLSTYCSGENVVLWITGHSRGAALANLLAAKRIDAGSQVFAYTFASPMTTDLDTVGTVVNYMNIFNIINEDDLVPELPLEHWGFTRYGQVKSESIEENYRSEWYALLGGSTTYESNKDGVIATVIDMSEIADNRSECYAYRYDVAGYAGGAASSIGMRDATLGAVIILYPEAVSEYWYVEYENDYFNSFYSYRIYQQPAFLMQLLAIVLSGTPLDGFDFFAIDVATYLQDTKYGLIGIKDDILHPHYPESYYLLATKITQ